MTKTLASALVLGLLGLAGCPDIKTDTGEGGAGPTVEFDPAASIIPFPNNLVLDPTTGRVNLPQQCNESLAQTVIRTSVINTLDGFGTYESALQVTFSEAIDMATLAGHVLLFQRARGTAANDPTAAKPIPVVLLQGTTMQSSADCSTSKMVTSLTIIAQGVLEQRSTYTVALTKGIKTAAGADFGPSFTWALVGQANAPVTLDTSGNVTTNHTPLDPRDPAQLAQLQGISQLWGAHKPALDFVEKTGHARSDVLVAWEFTTQSSDALDPAVAGTPAANIATGPLLGTQSITGNCVAPNTINCIDRAVLPYSQCAGTDPPTPAGNVQCFLKIALGQGVYSTGANACAQVGCTAVNDVLGAKLSSKNYQPGAVPGAWSDPVHPALVGPNLIDVLIFTPAAASVGTVVFGHGLGSSKKTAVAIAPQLAAKGFSTVAIDFVAHDSRAVRTSTDASKGCADVNNLPPDPTQAPQCYAPFLSNDLAGTRDNFRQTVLDLEGLVAALKACGSASCGALTVDPAHLSYLGISLGGIIGSTTVANVPDFKGAVLNVSGVGLVDILENTPSLAIRCSLVDALISVGVIIGTPSNPPLYTMGTCTTDAWKAQPSYQQFAAINRWTLDPADGANFTAKLATRKFLLQEVVNDQVVPNIATNNEGALVGLAGVAADPAIAPFPPASVVIKTNPTANKFVKYVNLAPSATTGFPGNTFQHASLLLPATTVQPGNPPPPCNPVSGVGCDGLLGTARLQEDAIEFLVNNH
jgi:dienelactone hydrolase